MQLQFVNVITIYFNYALFFMVTLAIIKLWFSPAYCWWDIRRIYSSL